MEIVTTIQPDPELAADLDNSGFWKEFGGSLRELSRNARKLRRLMRRNKPEEFLMLTFQMRKELGAYQMAVSLWAQAKGMTSTSGNLAKLSEEDYRGTATSPGQYL